LTEDSSISESRCINGVLTVRIEGEITYYERHAFKEKLTELYKNASASWIEINLLNVSCMDSSGLALLIEMYKLSGGHVNIVVAPGSQPARIISRANMASFFHIRYQE